MLWIIGSFDILVNFLSRFMSLGLLCLALVPSGYPEGLHNSFSRWSWLGRGNCGRFYFGSNLFVISLRYSYIGRGRRKECLFSNERPSGGLRRHPFPFGFFSATRVPIHRGRQLLCPSQCRLIARSAFKFRWWLVLTCAVICIILYWRLDSGLLKPRSDPERSAYIICLLRGLCRDYGHFPDRR